MVMNRGDITHSVCRITYKDVKIKAGKIKGERSPKNLDKQKAAKINWNLSAIAMKRIE